MAMMAITTSSSMSVNGLDDGRVTGEDLRERHAICTDISCLRPEEEKGILFGEAAYNTKPDAGVASG
jgi:hypothetical protein